MVLPASRGLPDGIWRKAGNDDGAPREFGNGENSGGWDGDGDGVGDGCSELVANTSSRLKAPQKGSSFGLPGGEKGGTGKRDRDGGRRRKRCSANTVDWEG
ncbi:hypothetical protein MUK42_24581 [Musa troglodytarum]|uniref:Uncharacterized protein n=1 Tax=Musa troglodytarum TaxID=320322 RepID=A0A9E7FMA0_9LILI|nr:hypothetical protein MUK42_24581 [Musa troglodytarum]